MIQFKNLTPHEVTVVDGDRSVTFQPSGQVARVDEDARFVGYYAAKDDEQKPLHIPVKMVSAADVTGLPEQEDNVVHIVSRMVADACPDRQDLVFPFRLIRDDQGRITGCTGFGVVA